MSPAEGIDATLRYHARSTHHPGRYAPGPGYLDWANQPEPFRTWAGAPVVELPIAGDDVTASWGDLHRPALVRPRPLDRGSLGAFFELALGITAWKEHRGARWALRANPSSGNLHPTEAYALLPGSPGLPAGLYHYVSRDHVLERRFTPSGASAAVLDRLLPAGAFLVGLASIHWREAWKYGERAFRYCQHDAGHALASIRYAAAALGWSARLLDAPGDDDVARLLGLDRDGDFGAVAPADREHPDGFLAVAPSPAIDTTARSAERGLDGLRECLADGTWAGTPNALSPEASDWPAIAEVAAATRKVRTADPSSHGRDGAPQDDAPRVQGAAPRDDWGARPGDGRAALFLIRGRRSAVDMDGTTAVPVGRFLAVLQRLLPYPGIPPWDVLPWAPRVHPVLFVHRVDGLSRGLYLLERAPGALQDLRRAFRPSFAWKPGHPAPPGVPLFLLEEGDTRPLARFASCQQEIAAGSAFAVAIIADLRDLERGAWWYRRLHWEAGVLGHVLYMEAEASGVRGTGIGCFFDDVVHETLGIGGRRFRDLYHFTVGGAVDDRRLTTSPGYDGAVRRRATVVSSNA
jgi:SagB-type dehydrogenase family enzyme